MKRRRPIPLGISTRDHSAALSLALLALCLLLPAAARANVAIDTFAAGPSITQAGAHPDFGIQFSFTNHQLDPTPCACTDPKNIAAHLPAGLIGNPHATPQCDIAQFSSDQCPIDSQLGVVSAFVAKEAGVPQGVGFLTPVFNLVPSPEEPALLGFKTGFANAPIFEVVSARTGTDYGLDVETTSIEHFYPLTSFHQLTWGIPASPLHDDLRFPFGAEPLAYFAPIGNTHAPLCDAEGHESTGDPLTIFQLCGEQVGGYVGSICGAPFYKETPFYNGGLPCRSQSPEIPFLQNPTTCGEASLPISLDVLGYEGSTPHAASLWPPTTDCSQLAFNPSQSIAPTTEAADSPSGAEFRLTVPQFESPSVPSPSELKAAEVTLPQGFSLAPNVTNGKTTCSDAQARFGTTLEAQCPEDSKIGTIFVETPVLPGPLPGAVYLGEPKPGNRFRLFLAFNGFGVHVKLAGTATPDPKTGQIHISFQNLPQAPFAEFNMHIFGSERGPLDTPTQCGTYEVQSVFTPWDSALSAQTSRQFFNVTEGPGGTPCPSGARPFHPGFQAAAASNTAGAHTAFSLNLTRQDGEQNLKSLNVTTPPGFAATLKGLTYCPEAAIAAAALESHTGLAEQANPSCPASSLIGEVVAGAGPGTHPLFLPGKVYLAGPYKGAPLSLVIITPAVSAGYDLGNVVVREGLKVNPETAQVSTVGAPLPQIFQGIPLRLRQIMVNLNRPGFALNPTNCDPFAVSAQAFGDEGGVSNSSTHFQVANCASLAFNPALALNFSGSTKRAGNPALKATLSYPKGGSYANVASTAVSLPPTEQIDNAHIRDPCTKVQFNLGNTLGEKCPAGSLIGFAKAETPLLDKPLEGPVYFRSAPENKSGLPDIVAVLKGQIEITLDGKIKTIFQKVNGERVPRIRTTFGAVPDAPVSKFTLSLDGGQKGLLQNSANLCKAPLRVNVKMAGQNGKAVEENPLLGIPCGKSAKKKHNKRQANAKRGGGR
jgi:hypothetical protein